MSKASKKSDNKKPTQKTRAPKKTAEKSRAKKGVRKSVTKHRAHASTKLVWFKRLMAFAIWCGVFFIGLILWFAWDIPDPDDIIEKTSRKPSITILASNNQEILKSGDVHGKVISVSELPAYVSHAVLATEDRRFYDHPGVDIVGLARAMWTNVLKGGIRQGGSTLTQQLAKNLFLTREKSIRRKVQEVFLAFWLEKRFTKDQLLSLYLNRIYLGAGVYGIDAAAHKFFAKPATKLSIYEAAVIAGLPKAPSRYNPVTSPEKSATRANQVLDNMVDAGWLTQKDANDQKRNRVTVTGTPAMGENRRYYTDWIMGRLEGFLGHIDQDVTVRTTLNINHQKIAEKHIQQIRQKTKARKADALAFISMTPDGAVTSMLGGYSWNESQFNRTTQAFRQPGSAFKPIVFLAGLEAGLTPDSQVDDKEISVEGWSPDNASGKHQGVMTLREGVARSSNSVAVAVSELAGRNNVLQMARRLGVSSTLRAEPAIALGVYETNLLELTGAYATIANDGFSAIPYGILEIYDGAGNILYSHDHGGVERMIDKKYVSDLNNMLAAVIAWGTGKNAKIDRPAAGKTGTSQDYKDAWFIGYSAELVAGIWMGNDNASPTDNITGGSFPAQLWKAFMKEALEGQPPKNLTGID